MRGASGRGPGGPGEARVGEVGPGRKRWRWMASGDLESVTAQLCGPGQTTSFSEPQFPPL